MRELNKIENSFHLNKIKFDLDKITSTLTVDNDEVDLDLKRDEAEKRGLSPKEEFHLTLIGSDTGEQITKLFENLGETERNRKIEEIKKLCESIDWGCSLRNEFYYIEKTYDESGQQGETEVIPEKRKSIIQMAIIDKLDEFYRKLNKQLNTNFATPLPHVTLYTTSTREDKKLRGIGLYSKEQFVELKPEKI